MRIDRRINARIPAQKPEHAKQAYDAQNRELARVQSEVLKLRIALAQIERLATDATYSAEEVQRVRDALREIAAKALSAAREVQK